MMFLVWLFSEVGVCQRPPESAVSGTRSFASVQAATHALQPMQSVVS